MVSSSRAVEMKTYSRSERDRADRDRDPKDSYTSSRHYRSSESGHGHRSRGEEGDLENREYRRSVEESSRRRSRSPHSRGDYYSGSRENRDHQHYSTSKHQDISRSATYPERDHYRSADYYSGSARYEEPRERSHREHYSEKDRYYKPTDSYFSRRTEEYYETPRKTDSYRRDRDEYQTSSREYDRTYDKEQERRHRDDYHSHHNRDQKERELSRQRDSLRREEYKEKEREYTKAQSESRSLSPEPEEEATEEKPSKSARRSAKQKQRTLKHLRARKAATDFLRQLTGSPSRENSEESGAPEEPSRHKSADQPSREPSPKRRRISNASVQEVERFNMNSGNHTPRHGHSYNHHPSQYAISHGSQHGSPHSAGSHGRGGWQGGYYAQQQYSTNAYSPHRQNSFPGSQQVDPHYYASGQYHQQQGYYSPNHYNSHTNGHYPTDRRFSGNQASPLNPNQSNANTSNAQPNHSQASTAVQGSSASKADDDNNPFRPPKNLRAEDEGPTVRASKESAAEASNSSNTASSSKVSFAFKAKPAPVTKPVDLASKMKEPKKENVMETVKRKASAASPGVLAAIPAKGSAPPTEPAKSSVKEYREREHREYPREPLREHRESHRDPYARTRDDKYHEAYERERHGHDRSYDERYRNDRYHERGPREDHRDYYKREYRHGKEYREERSSYREERLEDRRHAEYDRRRDYEQESRHKHESKSKPEPPKPQLIIVKKKMTRVLPRPTLPEEHAQSTSVYYRKPGNESVIGAGTYGKVFKAIQVYTKEEVALKKIRMEGERDGFPVTAIREVKLLQSLHHPNIVKLLEVMVEFNDCYMVFEYASHDLTGLLNHPNFMLSAAHKKHLIKQLFEGLDYLHRRGVLHRDIKAANILVTNRGELKLADFGLARFYKKHKDQDYTNRVITIWYRPPELLLGETQYGAAVDVWSAACVMMEVFTKHAIFPGNGHEIDQLEKVYNMLGTPTLEEWPGMKELAWFDFLRPVTKKPSVFADKFRERLTPQAFELMKLLFVYDPKNRPTAELVLAHSYFTTEEPEAAQAVELEDLKGDWHEFESKALRRKKEQRDRDARQRQAQDEHKRKATTLDSSEPGPDAKKSRSSSRNAAATNPAVQI